jgi:hypothetical protein
MTHRLAAVALVLLLAISGAISAGAQTSTEMPDDPFQHVTVNGFTYALDPYYPCVDFLIDRHTTLDPDQGPVTTIIMQGFHRDFEGQMVAEPAYPTTENEKTAQAEVGDSFPCDLQVAATTEEQDALDGG